MNVEVFIESINENNSYRNKLDKIINESNSIINDICYLIEEDWYTELNKNCQRFTNIQNIVNGNELSKFINFPRKDPIFINDFTELIENFKKNNEFKLVSKKLMEIIYKKEYLILNIMEIIIK